MAKSSSSSDNSGGSDNSDNTSSTNSGSLTNDVGNTIGQSITGAADSITSGITAPFTNWFSAAEADTANFANQVLNSIFYGVIALSGAGMMVWGLYKIFGDGQLGALTRTVAEGASFLAGPEVGVPTTAVLQATKSKPKPKNPEGNT